MKVINIRVTDKLTVTSVVDGSEIINANYPIRIPSGNYKSVLLNFEFESESWLETTLRKYATFSINGGTPTQVELTNINNFEYACYVPFNVLKSNNKVNIGLYGSATINNIVTKIVSSETLYFLVTDGAFSIFLNDDTPPKIETLEEQLKAIMDDYTVEKKADFNSNYQNKINNVNSSVLQIEEGLNLQGATVNPYADSKRIESTINHYFSLTRDEKIYTVKFPLWSTSNTCSGEKLDDNAGLRCIPATDTVREVSDYGIAWDSVDCNAVVDSNGVRHITALKGMSNFRDTGRVDVFCLFRTYWQKIWEDNGYLYISRSFIPRDGYDIVPQAINKDGTYNLWFVIGKYVVGDIPDEGTGTHKLYSSKGLIPAHLISGVQGSEELNDSVSHTGCISLMRAKGSNYYSAGLLSDYMHILTTFYLKFATKNTQSIMAGNTNNNFQYSVAQAESNTNRVILTTAQAANFDLYTCVSVGDVGSNGHDRYYGYTHNLAHNVKIIGKEVIDSSKTALVLEHAPFNTTNTTWVSSMHERSGFSDYILGRTGSIGSNTNGKHGFVLDGIELAVGGYEVAGNAFMNIVNATGKREVYYTNDVSKLTTNMTTAKSTYKKSSLSIEPTTLNAWNYITEYKFDTVNGLALPTKSGISGSSSSLGYADGLYVDNGSSGEREFLWFGGLTLAALAGLSCLYAGSAVSIANWNYLARLSINGVGGELA